MPTERDCSGFDMISSVTHLPRISSSSAMPKNWVCSCTCLTQTKFNHLKLT